MFSIKRVCYFNECDTAGIMFFGNAFSMAHACYEEWLRAAKLNDLVFKNVSVVFPIHSCSARYFSPVKHMHETTIQLKVVQVRDSSFELLFTALNDLGVKLFEVSTVHIAVNKENNGKSVLPEDLVDLLKQN